ncbi:phosphatase PAP2 family protein [Cellulophaga sp. E16_2]|uniref:Phosphoesterase PA-phosphatase related protein n=1 Tax=Cellulophaga algicola (strain DSM 14237 / IC166 / ACAM 630) TaxID=688270 RepID=E6X574_CELAD|nr:MULTISPECIES: phosphatase PAP2 family protein [Cellulophaga]ADV49410.1 phosphoesterase PA-phosphatase related protein [Cellulophaga algicola DSM 14237]MBO0591863.1 phosphatase PAP2 family protein [Cellulophaga sp. E16_2]
MLEELIKIDQDIFLYLNGLGTPAWDGFWMYLSRTLSLVTIPIYVFLLYYTYRSFGVKKTIYILIAVAALLLTTEQLSIIVKNSVARLRPCHDDEINLLMRNVKNHCGGKFGYFSAHAANSSALAVFFSLLFYKKNKLFLFALAAWTLLVSYSRIYLGVHYPLDIITGLTVGITLSCLYIFLLKKLPVFKSSHLI